MLTKYMTETPLLVQAEHPCNCDNCNRPILPSQQYLEEVVNSEWTKYSICDALSTMYTINYKPRVCKTQEDYADIKLCRVCGLRLTMMYRSFRLLAQSSVNGCKLPKLMVCLMRLQPLEIRKVARSVKYNLRDCIYGLKDEENQLVDDLDPLLNLEPEFTQVDCKSEELEDNSMSIEEGYNLESVSSPSKDNETVTVKEEIDLEKELPPEDHRHLDDLTLSPSNPINEPNKSLYKNLFVQDTEDTEDEELSGNEILFPSNGVGATLEEVSSIIGTSSTLEKEELKICRICGERQKTPRDLLYHLTKVHKIPMKTAEFHCQELKTLRAQMEDRGKGKLGNIKIPCDLCKQTFICDEMLEKHKLIAHSGRDPLTCIDCGKKFESSYPLKLHVYSVHLNIRPYQCTQCDKGFLTKTSLTAHEATHSGQQILCSICGQAFAHIKYLKTHERAKHFPYPKKLNRHKCDLCDKKFEFKNRLRLHKLTHEKKQDFICDLCGKGFNTPGDLGSHKKYHKDSETRPYKCPYCKNGYPTKHSLKYHLLSGAHNLSLEQAKKDAGIVSLV